MVEAFNTAIKYLDTEISTNYDGTNEDLEFMTLQSLYLLAQSKLPAVIRLLSLTKPKLPETMGANSLVFYADGYDECGKNIQVAIKIALQYTGIGQDEIFKLNQTLSENGISPKVYYQELFPFSDDNNLMIFVSERIIPYEKFVWRSVYQKKRAAVSLLDKVFRLHKLGIVHNDIKYENFGMNSVGEVYLFDFDNYHSITPNRCSVSSSSGICHPPFELRQNYIKNKMGNRIVDLFPAVACVLGDILGIRYWQFSNEQILEKTESTKRFNRGKIYYWIQKNMSRNFPTYRYSQEPFWYALTNLLYMILKESDRSKKSFNHRAKVLIERMRNNLI